jgi:hypothetical protein
MFEQFKHTLWELLPVDEEACVALLHPWGLAAKVVLVEGELSVREALTYARVLMELGREEEAYGVFEAVVSTLMQAPVARAA